MNRREKIGKMNTIIFAYILKALSKARREI